jgi:hypothetical protein
VAFFKEMPDGIIVVRGHGEIGVVPVHPESQPLGLLGLDPGEFVHPLLALVDEVADAIGLDVLLGPEAQLFFHLHLHPQALAVEAVLVAGVIALHGLVAVIQILVGAAPGVVHPHGVVGGDRPVHETETLCAAFVAGRQLLKCFVVFPEFQYSFFQFGKVKILGNVLVHYLLCVVVL